jgi:peroxiredoxin Q/BCP
MGKVFDGILRTTLIVNPQGQVVKRYDQVKTKGHAQTVLNDLKALIG